MHNFGEALKSQRELAGITQPDLAKKIGTSQANISRWERGEVLPNIAFCTQLAAFYGLTVDELFGCDEFSAEEKAAGFSDKRKVSITPIEDDMLYEFRQVGKKKGEEAQRALITIAKSMQ